MHSTTSQIRFSWERGFQRENLILSVPLFIFSRRITSYFNSTIHPHANNRPSIFNFRSSSFRREIFFIQSQQFSKTCSLPSQKLIAHESHEHKNFITKISYPKNSMFLLKYEKTIPVQSDGIVGRWWAEYRQTSTPKRTKNHGSNSEGYLLRVACNPPASFYSPRGD